MWIMDIYIHKDTVGLSQHLVCSPATREIRKVKDLPDTPLVYGTKQFEEISELFSISLPSFPPESQVRALKNALNGQELAKIPWGLTMDSSLFLSEIRKLGDFLMDNFSQLDLSYYQNHYLKTMEVFDALQPAKIDPVAWKVLGEKNDATQIVKSFKPDQLGFAEEVVYSRNTKTGRAKVVSGPKILLLPKANRSLLTSRFGKNGKIMVVDYRALEPRVVLALKELTTTSNIPLFSPSIGYLPLALSPTGDSDLYAEISKKLGIKDVSRDAMKEIVISLLYGASYETISSALHSVRDVDGLIEVVNDLFGLPELRSRLQSENEASGRNHIFSYYGRHVNTKDAEDYMLVNYYSQSTAVDVALYGFRNLLERLQGSTTIIPLFFAHDSLVLDVAPKEMPSLPELCKVATRNIPLLPGATFPLKVSEF